MPPGLKTLPPSLLAVTEFLRIDPHLVSAAAEASAPMDPEPEGMAAWIAELPRPRRTPCCSGRRRASTRRSRRGSSDASDPKHPGLKKALARVKRALRAALT